MLIIFFLGCRWVLSTSLVELRDQQLEDTLANVLAVELSEHVEWTI